MSGVSSYNSDDEELYNETHCNNCQATTLIHLDFLYMGMINLIKDSIFEFILCLKYLGLSSDMKRLLGELVWNTRKDVEWIALNNYKSDEDNTQE